MKENQGMQLKQYAETFTKKWNRNVTERFVFSSFRFDGLGMYMYFRDFLNLIVFGEH